MNKANIRSPRLRRVFEQCRQDGRSALIGYLTAGDPDRETSLELLQALAAQTDILEIGMPFSDPMADGPVIQAASERALAAGAHIDDVFTLTQAVRDAYPDLAIVLMGYANTPYAMGFDAFADKAQASGADGALLVDIPPEEGGVCDDALESHGLDRILLLSPTSPDERIRLACEKGSGFIYYVSLTGITGADMGDMQEIRNKVEHIKELGMLPVCVGFGIKTAAQAAEVAAFSDGIVVGSHFVSRIASSDNACEMRDSVSSSAKEMRQAVAAAT